MGRTRTYHNRYEQEQLVEQWQNSKLTAKVFCEQHDIRLSTFHNWHARINKQQRSLKVGPKLIPVEIAEPYATSANNFKVSLPNGISIDVNSLGDAIELITALTKESPLCL